MSLIYFLHYFDPRTQYLTAEVIYTDYRNIVKQLLDVKVLVQCESRIVLNKEKNHDE